MTKAKRRKRATTSRAPKRVAKRTTAKRKVARRKPSTRAKPQTRRVTKAAAPSARATKAAAVAVAMTIDFGLGAPGDIQSIRRIDSRALPTGQANVARGQHTASWDVISPTVRPIAYSVTITEVLTGRVLLSRPNERTGSDGKGAGADNFTV